jgi:hypothetical protein
MNSPPPPSLSQCQHCKTSYLFSDDNCYELDVRIPPLPSVPSLTDVLGFLGYFTPLFSPHAPFFSLSIRPYLFFNTRALPITYINDCYMNTFHTWHTHIYVCMYILNEYSMHVCMYARVCMCTYMCICMCA